jgi:hypothetical protein
MSRSKPQPSKRIREQKARHYFKRKEIPHIRDDVVFAYGRKS